MKLEAEEREPCGAAGALAAVATSGRAMPDLGDCLAARATAFRIVIWEPLRTKAPAPPKAAPYCCLRQTVIFYHFPHIVSSWATRWRGHDGKLRADGGSAFLQWDSIKTRLGWEDVVTFEGERYAVQGGRVVWKAGRWWSVHHARKEAR